MSRFQHKQETRAFTGKLAGFTSKLERNFESKRLKGYLKGEELFQFGKDQQGYPRYFRVDTGQLLHEATQ